MAFIKVADGAEKYIGLQRLETQALGSKIHYQGFGHVLYCIYERIPFSKSIYRFYSTMIEPRLRREQIFQSYSVVMEREYESIKPHLPSKLETIMGIGPGVAGLEVFLSWHCSFENMPEPHIVLIDKTGVDPIHFGFQKEAAAYNSLATSKKTLIENGHGSGAVETVEAELAAGLINRYRGKVTLVTSLIAWGFHFPVDTYLDLVFDLLEPGGRLIIDVRKGTDGHDLLRKTFGQTTVILDDEKFERVLVEK